MSPSLVSLALHIDPSETTTQPPTTSMEDLSTAPSARNQLAIPSSAMERFGSGITTHNRQPRLFVAEASLR